MNDEFRKQVAEAITEQNEISARKVLADGVPISLIENLNRLLQMMQGEAALPFGYVPKDRIHRLKVWPDFYGQLITGLKRFEIRRDDRGFMAGDVLVLEEWNPGTETYTGRACVCTVQYVLREAEEFGLAEGFVCMSISQPVPTLVLRE